MIKDRELFDLIDVEEMLSEMGIRNVRNTYSGEIEFSCPFPGHTGLDSHPSATMSVTERPAPDGGTYPKTSFYCFACGMKGSAITFVSEYEGVSHIVAKRFLKERFAPFYVEPEGSTEEMIRSILEEKLTTTPGPKPLQIIDDSILEKFAINWPEVHMAWEETQHAGVPEPLAYMLDRGFEPETLEDFNVGYDEISSHILFPVRNADGYIIGFKGRAWWPDAHPRYKAIGGEEYGFETYSMGRVLFALNIAKNHLVFDRPLIVREGELNVMMLHQMGVFNSTGISGKRVSQIQQQLIRKYADRVAFWFDDVADSMEAASHFIDSMPVSIIESEKDPADSTRLEVVFALQNMKSALELQIVR